MFFEYTATIQQEMANRSSTEQEKLLTDGLTTKPAICPVFFRSYEACGRSLRSSSMTASCVGMPSKSFFDLETQLSTGQISEKLQAVSTFNASVVRLAQRAGITEFTGVIYKPFPDHTSLSTIIKSLESPFISNM